ncbi:MAG: polymorphic toxin type 50 domain-containing protein [Bacteriovoracaceae bacterium]
MNKLLILLLILFVFPALAGTTDPICQSYARQNKFVSGDTIYWENKVLPQFDSVLSSPRLVSEAINNQKYKGLLASYGLGEGDISTYNQQRIVSHCSGHPNMEGCYSMQNYCVRDFIDNKLPEAVDNTINCLQPWNRPHCGQAFATPEGIQLNLDVLLKVDKKLNEIKQKNLNRPYVGEYLTDLDDAFKAYSAKVQEAIKLGKKQIEDLKKEEASKVAKDYENAKKNVGNLGKACAVFDQCKTQIETDGYKDNRYLLDQISSCNVDKGTPVSAELKDAMSTMEKIESEAVKGDAAILVKQVFSETIKKTADQYISSYIAINNKVPSEAEVCAKLGQCSKEVKDAYVNVIGKASQIPRMNVDKEIDEFNTKVRALNQICAEGKSAGDAYQDMLYNSSFGNLMAIEKFSNLVGNFNPDKCVEDGQGMKEISKTDKGSVQSALGESLNVLSDKSKELIKNKADLTNPNDPFSGMRYFLEYEPLVIRDVIRNSNDPQKAMLLCYEIEQVYRKEKHRKIFSGVLTGLSVAGALVATVITGGGAAPLLIAATSIALGVGNGLVNYSHSKELQKHYEQSFVAGTFDRNLAENLISQYQMEAKAEAVGVALTFVPGAGKLIGKGISKVSASFMGAALKTTPVWGNGVKLLKPASDVLSKVKAGQTVLMKDFQIALASKVGPKTSQVMVQGFNGIAKGMGEDAALTFGSMALTHPDPYSASGVTDLLVALAQSRGVSALGSSGRAWLLANKGKKELAGLGIKFGNDKTPATTTTTVHTETPPTTNTTTTAKEPTPLTLLTSSSNDSPPAKTTTQTNNNQPSVNNTTTNHSTTDVVINSKGVDAAKQGKHVPGHNNYIPGKSVLTKDAADLLAAYKANKVKKQAINGEKTRVDFGEKIGLYIDPVTGESVPTTNGIVHYSSKNNSIHIVPAKPNSVIEMPADYFGSLSPEQAKTFQAFKDKIDFDNLPPAKKKELLDKMYYDVHKKNNGTEIDPETGKPKVEWQKKKTLIDLKKYLMKEYNLDDKTASQHVRAMADDNILGSNIEELMNFQPIEDLSGFYKSTSEADVKKVFEDLVASRDVLKLEFSANQDMTVFKAKKKYDQEIKSMSAYMENHFGKDELDRILNGATPEPSKVVVPDVIVDVAADKKIVQNILSETKHDMVEKQVNRVNDMPLSSRTNELSTLEAVLLKKKEELMKIHERSGGVFEKENANEKTWLKNSINNIDQGLVKIQEQKKFVKDRLDSYKETSDKLDFDFSKKEVDRKIKNMQDNNNTAGLQSYKKTVQKQLDDMAKIKRSIDEGQIPKDSYPDINNEIERLTKQIEGL